MAVGQGTRRIVFCDFDGTITAEETFVGLLKQFTPKLYAQKARQMKSGDITLKEAVRSLLESIPSARYPAMLDYIRGRALRPGLEKFLDCMQNCSIPVVVVSGGLRDLVHIRLGNLNAKIEAIYAADVSHHEAFLKVGSDFEGKEELVSKVDVMRQYTFDEAVVVGNGITDVKMSMQASLVFARGYLADYLRKHAVTFQPWRDFFDVTRFLDDYT